MSNYVLFSPLGMTDPTRGFHDGAFIHICRVYKPKKVYLYMSKEIYQYDKRDNRYERYLKANKEIKMSILIKLVIKIWNVHMILRGSTRNLCSTFVI